MIVRLLAVLLTVFAAILAVSWWEGWPLPMAILGGIIFAGLAAWDDAFYVMGAWRDEWWDDD